MTNYWENLDAILTQYRLDYLNCKRRGDWIAGANCLFDRNSAHPPEAYISDMPRFTINTPTLKAKIHIQDKARRYCEYWNEKLELAMANHRKANQNQYNRV